MVFDVWGRTGREKVSGWPLPNNEDEAKMMMKQFVCGTMNVCESA